MHRGSFWSGLQLGVSPWTSPGKHRPRSSGLYSCHGGAGSPALSAQGNFLLLAATLFSGAGDGSWEQRAQVSAALICGMGLGRVRWE